MYVTVFPMTFNETGVKKINTLILMTEMQSITVRP